MSHTLINCTYKNRLGCSLLPFTLIPQYLKRFIKNTLKQTKFEYKTVKSTQLSLVLVGLRNFQINPDRTRLRKAWKWETRKHMFGLSLFRLSRQSKISIPWENKISQMPFPRANKDNQIPTPCPASSSPPPAGITLIGVL